MPSGIAEDELRAVIDQMVEEDTYTAGVGLSIARAWYRAHPEMVACEQAPELFEWAFQRRGETLDSGDNDFGPLERGYERRIRVDAIGTLKRRVACHGNTRGCIDEPNCARGARWRKEVACS